MPVDEEIDLSKPLSEDDIRKLTQEADQIEEAAERAENAGDKLEKNADKAEEEVRKLAKNLQEAEEKERKTLEKLMNSDKIRKIAEKHGLTSGTGPTGALGGGDDFEDKEPRGTTFGGADETGSGAVLPADRPRDKMSRTPMQQLSQYQQLLQDMKNKQNVHGQRLKHIETKREHLMRRMGEIERGQERALREFQKGLSFVSNPIGNVQNRIMGLVGKAIPIGMIIAITQQVIELIIKTFGPGGINDIRKIVKDEVTIFMDTEVYNKINRGEIFFGAAGAELTQGVGPAWSNTQDLFYMQQRDAANDFAGRE